jgi:hypothetical protein
LVSIPIFTVSEIQGMYFKLSKTTKIHLKNRTSSFEPGFLPRRGNICITQFVVSLVDTHLKEWVLHPPSAFLLWLSASTCSPHPAPSASTFSPSLCFCTFSFSYLGYGADALATGLSENKAHPGFEVFRLVLKLETDYV